MIKLPENLQSTYRFVTLASMRAEQLQAGAIPRLKSQHRKSTVVAQEEVAAGLVDEYDPNAVQEEAPPAAEGGEGSEG